MSDSAPNLPSGPTRETLLRLKGMMHSYMEAKDQGVRIAKGKVQQVLRPRKFCKVCGLTWDRVFVDPSADLEMAAEICGKCDGMLKEGFVAVVSNQEKESIWMRASGDLEAYRGSIVHVSHEVYSAARQRLEQIQREKNDGNGEYEQQSESH